MSASLPIRRRPAISRLLLLAALIVLAGCKQQLYTALSERDANEMIAVLAGRGLQADKVAGEKGDFKLELDRDDFSAAIEALRDRGLPRPKFASIGEVFKKDGLVTTANAERLRFMYAMSEELSRTLSMIDGVVEARVHPVLPGGDPLTDKVTPASASVFIKYTPGADLTLLAPAIKDLVCSSIEGLTYDKVSLVFVPASNMVASTHVDVPAGASGWLGVPYSTLGLGLAVGMLGAGVWLFVMREREDAGETAGDPRPPSPAPGRPDWRRRLRAKLPRWTFAARRRTRSARPPERAVAASDRSEPVMSAAAAPLAPTRGDVVSIEQRRRSG